MASRGEIWFCDFDPVVGHEQAGDRPALIISHDSLNKSAADLVVVVPVTKVPGKVPTHVPVTAAETGLPLDSTVLCEHIRTIDKARLRRKAGQMPAGKMAQIEQIVKRVLALP